MTVARGVPVLTEPVVPVRRSWIGLLFAANLGLWMAFFTPIQVLLPEQIDALVTHDKENWLSLVTAVVTTPEPGYLLMAGGLLALALPFALLTPDDVPGPAPAVTVRRRLDLRGNPDFAWAWGTRFLVQLGNALGTLYLLFFLK